MPYDVNNPGIPYKRLFRDLSEIERWIPSDIGVQRRDTYLVATLLAVTAGLIGETWTADTSTPDSSRRDLADRLLHSFESRALD